MRIAMIENDGVAPSAPHSHVFLGEGHEKSERKTWAVIWLCGAMMIAEIVGGWLFGSIALIADGLHMSTHAGALCSRLLLTLTPASTPVMHTSHLVLESLATSPGSPAPLSLR
jgi:Co/Zn/Cd efflux system component